MIRREREKEEMTTTIKCSAGESDGGHQWQRSSDNFETCKNYQVKA
jgi:hypothetical protein